MAAQIDETRAPVPARAAARQTDVAQHVIGQVVDTGSGCRSAAVQDAEDPSCKANQDAGCDRDGIPAR